MPTRRQQLVLVLAAFAGVFLIVSGTNGPIGIYQAVLESLPSFIQDPLILSIANSIAFVFMTLSSLGGITVILGGCLVFINHVRTGKLAISIGTGVGILWLIFVAFTLIVSGDWSLVLSEHSPIGWVGIVLSFIAVTIAR